MINTRLTAKEANVVSNSMQAAVDDILLAVWDAAKEGKKSIKVRDYGFCDGGTYCREDQWPSNCKMILKELRELGYTCTGRANEAQFVDLWLEVSWGDA